ncbi:MAG: hypothetical protein WAX85_00710 [Minisyncoccia bacterium]
MQDKRDEVTAKPGKAKMAKKLVTAGVILGGLGGAVLLTAVVVKKRRERARYEALPCRGLFLG